MSLSAKKIKSRRLFWTPCIVRIRTSYWAPIARCLLWKWRPGRSPLSGQATQSPRSIPFL